MNKLKSLILCPVFLLGACLATAQTDGLYATAENNYRIEVKFTPGKLTVVEPNKTSEYIQRPGTAIYDFNNPTNGISYVLEVTEGGKALKAYKPATPENFTPLKLVRAAAPPAAETAAGAGVERIPVQNVNAANPDLEELWGVRTIEGLQLEGRYTPQGEARPFIQLASDGTGIFEMYGAPDPKHVYRIKWWVLANKDGTLVQTDHAAASAYTLIVEFLDKMYQGQKFDRLQLAVQKSPDGRIYIMDRSKPKTGN